MEFISGLNYAAWFIFVFIAVVWVLVLLQNKAGLSKRIRPGRLVPVSIIIPAYNEALNIAACVRSMLSLDYPKRLLDIIVVDDCSTDGTGKIARGFRKQGVRVLSNSRNRGKAYSLNKGIAASSHGIVACVDADSVVEPSILKNLVGYFRDPKVGSVTPALKVFQPKGFLQKVQAAEYLLNVFLRKMLAFMDSIHVTPGVFSLYRKGIVVKAGGFEEGNLTEDMDIALKVHEAGYRIENNMSAVSYTNCPSTWKALFKQRVRWYRGAIQNTIKYRHMLFNREYGNLGIFLLPANFISILAIIGIFLIMAANYISMAFQYLWKASLVGWSLEPFIRGMTLTGFVDAALSTPALFALFGLALGGYILWKSFGLTGEKLSENRPGYLVYLIFFPVVMMAFWTAAIVQEVRRAERKW